ncbi:hypothetical protein LSAT2_023197, partial [Lamellibrachia satsuma]
MRMLRERSRPHKFQPGDDVQVKQQRRHKAIYPYKVDTFKGSMITAKRSGHQITRNSSHFKALKGGQVSSSSSSSSSSSDTEDEHNDDQTTSDTTSEKIPVEQTSDELIVVPTDVPKLCLK